MKQLQYTTDHLSGLDKVLDVLAIYHCMDVLLLCCVHVAKTTSSFVSYCDQFSNEVAQKQSIIRELIKTYPQKAVILKTVLSNIPCGSIPGISCGPLLPGNTISDPQYSPLCFRSGLLEYCCMMFSYFLYRICYVKIVLY